jgi:Zn-dependent metalloprotease
MYHKRFLAAFTAFLLLTAFIPDQPAYSASVAIPEVLRSLRQQSDGNIQVAYHGETGKVRFLRTESGHPIKRPAQLTANATAEQVARQFLTAYGSLFGLRDQSQELKVMQQEASGGQSFVRFQQRYRGIPILAGELIVQTDRQGAVVSANGEMLPGVALDITAQINAKDARDRALAAIAKYNNLRPADLQATAPELWVYNPALLGGPGLRRNSLTWRMDVTGTSADTLLRELVLVDAQTGTIALHFNQIDTAKERHICNMNNVRDTDQNPDNNCTPATYVRSEGQAATGNADVDLAYDYSGATYDYFKNNFGRDSLDNAGMPLISMVKYCYPLPEGCPYENAFWNGRQMTYGDGYASADDVVGHELAHGFTEFTSHLFYYYQSGAINESLSDVFGELIDQTDGLGDDSAGVRWQLGEDLPAAVGVIRNMQNPPSFGDPDRTGSGLYYGGELDGGGVHSNSGVNNKATFLMTSGGTFNGQTITGLGLAKVGQIYYKVGTSFLTSGSDYQDLGDALPAACSALIGSSGIVAADCEQVVKVVLATEMNQVPTNAAATDAPICAAGQAPNNLFFDDLENPASGNWISSATVGTNAWYYPATSHPYNFDARYATSGVHNFWGYNQNSVADYNIRMTHSVLLPSSAFLHFRHAYDFEHNATTRYDGGLVEYSTNGGTAWIDAGTLFTNNGYNGTIDNTFGNPLGGKQAFTGVSKGYYSSRAGLSSLSGQSVRFRFRIGTDNLADDYGWFIDDVRIYTCVAVPAISSFTPTSGPAGTSVTITGQNFNGASAVTFNGTSASFTIGSPTSISAIVPVGATSGPIGVTTPAGTATSASNFTVTVLPPAISSFTPTSGPAGTSVTITGQNFNGASAITFNGTSASFTVDSPTSISAIVPVGATSGPIGVTTPGGTATSATNFTVTIVPPVISSFTPTSGPAGTSVTITGQNFTGASVVSFNGTSASFTVNSATKITAIVPVGATTGTISVTTPGGTATSASNYFVAAGAPTYRVFVPIVLR